MSVVAKTLLGCGHGRSKLDFVFSMKEPFHTDILHKVETPDGHFSASDIHSFEGLEYVYIGYVVSHPHLRGMGTGQGRRLIGAVLDYALSYPLISAVTCYVVNPVALHLLGQEATQARVRMAAYISNADKTEPIKVSDVRSSEKPWNLPRLDTIREGRSVEVPGSGTRFPGGLGFQTVIALEE